MIKKRFISMLVLLAAVATGAVAQTETLLTTITATAKEQASYSTANVATVSFSYTAGGSSAYLANWGWCTPILAYTSKGIKKIDVYGYVTPTTVDVTLADGTEDASNWQGKAGEGEYQSLPLTGLEAGTAVTVKYNGTKKVKSVKAKKKQ